MRERNIPEGVADWVAVLDDSIGILQCLPTMRQGKCYKSRPCKLPKFRLDGRPIPLLVLICKNPWQIVINFLSLDIPWFAKLDMNSFVININNTAKKGLFTINSDTEIKLKLRYVNIGVAKGSLKIKGLIRYDCTKPRGTFRWKERAIYNLKAPNFQYNKKFYKLRIRLEVKIRRFNWFKFDYVCKRCQNLVNRVRTFGNGPQFCIPEANKYIKWHRRMMRLKRKEAKEDSRLKRQRRKYMKNKNRGKLMKQPINNGRLLHIGRLENKRNSHMGYLPGVPRGRKRMKRPINNGMPLIRGTNENKIPVYKLPNNRGRQLHIKAPHEKGINQESIDNRILPLRRPHNKEIVIERPSQNTNIPLKSLNDNAPQGMVPTLDIRPGDMLTKQMKRNIKQLSIAESQQGSMNGVSRRQRQSTIMTPQDKALNNHIPNQQMVNILPNQLIQSSDDYKPGNNQQKIYELNKIQSTGNEIPFERATQHERAKQLLPQQQIQANKRIKKYVPRNEVLQNGNLSNKPNNNMKENNQIIKEQWRNIYKNNRATHAQNPTSDSNNPKHVSVNIILPHQISRKDTSHRLNLPQQKLSDGEGSRHEPVGTTLPDKKTNERDINHQRTYNNLIRHHDQNQIPNESARNIQQPYLTHQHKASNNQMQQKPYNIPSNNMFPTTRNIETMIYPKARQFDRNQRSFNGMIYKRPYQIINHNHITNVKEPHQRQLESVNHHPKPNQPTQIHANTLISDKRPFDIIIPHPTPYNIAIRQQKSHNHVIPPQEPYKMIVPPQKNHGSYKRHVRSLDNIVSHDRPFNIGINSNRPYNNMTPRQWPYNNARPHQNTYPQQRLYNNHQRPYNNIQKLYNHHQNPYNHAQSLHDQYERPHDNNQRPHNNMIPQNNIHPPPIPHGHIIPGNRKYKSERQNPYRRMMHKQKRYANILRHQKSSQNMLKNRNLHKRKERGEQKSK